MVKKIRITTVIEAEGVQFDGTNIDEVIEFIGIAGFARTPPIGLWFYTTDYSWEEASPWDVDVIPEHTPTWAEIHGMPDPDGSLTTPGGDLPEVL